MEVAQGFRAEQRLNKGREGLRLKEGFLEKVTVLKNEQEFTRPS